MGLPSLDSATALISQFERQRRLADSLVDPLAAQRWVERHRRQQRLIEDSFGFREREKMLQRMVRPQVFDQLARQQKLLDDLVKGPAFLGSLGGLSATAPAVLDHADQFRDEVAAEAEVEEIDKGEDPLPRLAAEREAILTCLARVRESVIVAGLLDVPVSNVILALVIAAVVIGEVADEILREREARIAAERQ